MEGVHKSYLFALADSTKSNSITRQEFFNSLALCGMNLVPSEENAIFEYFDATGDGHIDYAEFMATLGDDKALTQPRWNPSGPDRYRRDEEALAEAARCQMEALRPSGYDMTMEDDTSDRHTGRSSTSRRHEYDPHYRDEEGNVVGGWRSGMIHDQGHVGLEDKARSGRWLQANEGIGPDRKHPSNS